MVCVQVIEQELGQLHWKVWSNKMRRVWKDHLLVCSCTMASEAVWTCLSRQCNTDGYFTFWSSLICDAENGLWFATCHWHNVAYYDRNYRWLDCQDATVTLVSCAKKRPKGTCTNITDPRTSMHVWKLYYIYTSIKMNNTGYDFDWCCFYYFVRNSLVALLEALCARIFSWDSRISGFSWSEIAALWVVGVWAPTRKSWLQISPQIAILEPTLNAQKLPVLSHLMRSAWSTSGNIAQAGASCAVSNRDPRNPLGQLYSRMRRPTHTNRYLSIYEDIFCSNVVNRSVLTLWARRQVSGQKKFETNLFWNRKKLTGRRNELEVGQ